jgi:hypothetical protein
MGVADRVRRKEQERRMAQLAAVSPTDSAAQSSDLVRVEPAHIKRMKGVMYVLTNYVQDNDAGSLSRMAFLMTHMTDELAEELADYDELAIRIFMYQIGEVIAWIGHGDNSRLPDAVLPFARLIQPDPETPNGDDAGTDRRIELPEDVTT